MVLLICVNLWTRSVDGLGDAKVRVKRKPMNQAKFPPGWDEKRVRKVLQHYEDQTEEEAVAEDEAAWEDPKHTTMAISNDLVPAVRELLAKRGA
jgi:hypothetical protein